jgi:hypothetical protein
MPYSFSYLYTLVIILISVVLFCSCETKTTNHVGNAPSSVPIVVAEQTDTVLQKRVVKTCYLRDRFGDTIKFSYYERQSSKVYIIDGRKFIVPTKSGQATFSKSYITMKFQPIRLKIFSQKVQQYLDTLLRQSAPKTKIIVSKEWLANAKAYHQKPLIESMTPPFLQEGYEKMTYFAFYEKNIDKDEEMEIILLTQSANSYSKAIILLDKENAEWQVKNKYYQEQNTTDKEILKKYDQFTRNQVELGK